MKRFKWSAVAIAPLLFAGHAVAGDYHTDGTLLCSACHVMHFSQTHGYNPDGTGLPIAGLGSAGPYEFLLRNDVNSLCLACHDENGLAPDVLGASNGGNEPTAVRNAGYLNRLGVSTFVLTGHTLDSDDIAPGSTPPWQASSENGAGNGLNCTNCHHQHGYAGGFNAYRNLRMDPGNLGFLGGVVTYNDTTIPNNDLTKDVFERAPATYDEAFIDWNEPLAATEESAIAIWCGGCHGDFHSPPGGAQVGGQPNGTSYDHFVRHPSSGVNIGDLGGGHSSLTQFAATTNRVKVMSEVGVWDPPGTDVTPTCISCHKAHGNGNAFGLIYRSGTGTLTEDGDTNGDQLEHLCGQCHVQASFFNSP